MIKKDTTTTIMCIVLVILFSLGFHKLGRNQGFHEGALDALDTVNTIVKNQIKSDTTVAKLLIECNGKGKLDTNTYFLSRKTCLKR